MKRALSLCRAGVVIVAVAFSEAAFADDEPAKPSDCALVRTSNHWGRAVLDERTVVVEPSPRRQFKVTFRLSCPDLKWARFMRVAAQGVCLSPGDMLLFSRSPFRHDTPDDEVSCMVGKVEGLPLKPERRGRALD